MTLYRIGPDFYAFHCPGCGCGHGVTVNGRLNEQSCSWQWNGDLDRPTFSPSVDCNKDDPKLRCHSFVTDGKILFLHDSWHALKGRTVDLPMWEDL